MEKLKQINKEHGAGMSQRSLWGNQAGVPRHLTGCRMAVVGVEMEGSRMGVVYVQAAHALQIWLLNYAKRSSNSRLMRQKQANMSFE